MKTKNKKTWRFPRIVFGVFFVFILVLIIQFAYLSLSPSIYGTNMTLFAKNRNTVNRVLNASRGTIYDASGNTLALNVSSYTVIAYLSDKRTTNPKKPNHVVDKEATAKALSPIINMSEEDILNLLSTDAYQVELGPGGRGITELKKEEIENLELPGIDFIESQKRYYPNGDFASYIIGYAKENEDGVITGELGVESNYNELLSGKDGSLTYQQDRNGYKIPDTNETRIEPVNGSNIYLTIDSGVQRFLESAVKETEENYNPEWMMITAMEAKTGKVLGSASTPSYDPNIRNIQNYENPLVTYLYEPGSTMKTFTYMCAMENGKYNGADTFRSGNFTIGEYTIRDWNVDGWGTITFDKGFEYSSNVGIANLLDRYITKEELKECFDKYGFGKKTGIEIARELKGNTSLKYKIEVANAGFGQGITTTAIQHLQALTMIANDGYMLKPHIIEKISDPNTGKDTYTWKLDKTEKIISTDTVNKIKELMHNVVYGEDVNATTGRAYRIEGFDIIAKTGTAQIFDTKLNKYLYGTKNDYIFSVSLMYPRENPEIIIYAAMKKPTWGEAKGLKDAIAEVVKNVSKYKGMFSEIKTQNESSVYTMKSFTNKNVDEVVNELSSYGIDVKKIGTGSKIINQYPQKGSNIVSGDKVILITNDKNYILPNLRGLSRHEAKYILNYFNIDYEMEGYGYVTEQSINDAALPLSDKLKIILSDKFSIGE